MIVLYVLAALILLLATALITCVLAIAIRTYRATGQPAPEGAYLDTDGRLRTRNGRYIPDPTQNGTSR